MKLSTFFVITAIVAIVFGLAFLLIPGTLLSGYGVSVNTGLAMIARLFGAALIGIAILAWGVRNIKDSEALRAVLLAYFVSETIGFIVALVGQLSGAVNALGWSTVIIYFLLALGFCYFLFRKQDAPESNP